MYHAQNLRGASPGSQTATRPLRLPLQDAAQSSSEDVRLRLGRDATGIEHFLVALKLAVELLDLAAEYVGTENHLFKRADVGFRRMRAHDAGPPEYRFENLVILLELDQGRSGK